MRQRPLAMIVHLIRSKPGGTSVGLAEISPQTETILAQENLSPELANLHPKKQLESLAARELIQKMCARLGLPFRGIRKDGFGKPYLTDSVYHISISHSYPMMACSLHPIVPCGIDIESPRSQLLKVKHKFLNAEELAYCGVDLEKLCLHWSVKEALYKIHGRKSLVFAEQLAIRSISKKEIKAHVILQDGTEKFVLNHECFLGYIIVYNI